MPPSEQPRVFISYARKDGAVLAQRLQASLKENDFDAWLDTQRIEGGRVWSTDIEGAIKSCGVMIALMSPGSYASEICRSEQLLALDLGIRVIPVLAAKTADRPIYLYAKQYRDFSNDADYIARLAELFDDIRGDATATLPESYRKTRVTYLTAPPRVANYLERPGALHALRDALFAEDHRQPIALTALAGMGGIGKTVLAKALTDDQVVQRAFPDGIVWITARKERKRDFIAEMREVAKALGDDLSGYDTALACENQYRTTIANKAALIVVDDVWSKSDIEPLLAESPRSRFLFTTRDAAIGRFVSAHEHRADLLDVTQSRELLASWANLPVAELPAAADDMIAECGRLPLALSVVGAMLRDEDSDLWTYALSLLRKADLSAIEDQLPAGQQSFFKAVEVSFQALKPEMQERYKALAVLLDDMAAPLPILQTLWNVNAAEAQFIVKRLVDRSLAQRDDGGKSIRLHDLQLDYVRAQYQGKEALEVIHGAMRLSSHVIAKDPSQFSSQMVGRLLPYLDIRAIASFTERVAEGERNPWLRSLHSVLHPPGAGLLRTLSGHSDAVTAVALTPDGGCAVSGSKDKTLKVWDLATGKELSTLAGHSDVVNSVALSGDGRIAISASGDQTLIVWDVASGRELHTLRGHGGSVYGVASSGDGWRAVSASEDGTLKVWDLRSGREVHTLSGHTAEVYALAVAPDGYRAVSGSGDGTLKLWDLRSGRELRTLAGHSNAVNSVAVSKDGRRAVSACDDMTLKVWDLDNGVELRTLSGHTNSVNGIGLSLDGRLAVSASADQTLRVWDVESGRELSALTGHASYVNAAAVTPNGQGAVSASDDGTLKVWELGKGRELSTTPRHADWVLGVVLSADGRLAVSASSDKTLKVWDLGSGRELHNLVGHSSDVLGVALSGDGRIAASASWDETVKVWDVASGSELRSFRGHSARVHDVALSGDGRLAISASDAKTLKVWDVTSGQELRTLVGHTSAVTAVAMTPDGQLAVSGGYDGSLRVWDVASGRESHILAGHPSLVNAVALNENARLAVSASYDQTLKVWDLSTGRELGTLTGHTDPVLGVALSRDGRIAVSASWDNTLKVWGVETGDCLATFTCDGAANCCAFSDALQLIVAGDAGGHVHFLRLEEPEAKG